MRRVAALGLVALAVMLPACANTERPEGVVERWLTSLNQGKAGEPGRYAPDDISEQVLPNWRTLDPGQLDLIEVGRGEQHDSTLFDTPIVLVPFRVVDVDDVTVVGTALVSPGGRIADLDESDPQLPLPSTGGPRIESATATLWLVAIGVAGLLILVSAGLMALVQRRSVSTS